MKKVCIFLYMFPHLQQRCLVWERRVAQVRCPNAPVSCPDAPVSYSIAPVNCPNAPANCHDAPVSCPNLI